MTMGKRLICLYATNSEKKCEMPFIDNSNIKITFERGLRENLH